MSVMGSKVQLPNLAYAEIIEFQETLSLIEELSNKKREVWIWLHFEYMLMREFRNEEVLFKNPLMRIEAWIV